MGVYISQVDTNVNREQICMLTLKQNINKYIHIIVKSHNHDNTIQHKYKLRKCNKTSDIIINTQNEILYQCYYVK